MKQHHRKLKNILWKYLVTGNWSVSDFDYRWKNCKDDSFYPRFYKSVEIYNQYLGYISTCKNTNNIPKFISDFKEAYDLFIELKMSDEELLELVTELKSFKQPTQQTHQREKDNSIWGKSYSRGNGSNRNTTRFPKKCRKTAWKRFYKLFPDLKPDNND